MHNVVVTGASRGLGMGIAEKLGASGFNVIAVARSPGATTNKMHFRAFDLSEIGAIPEFVKNITREFGPLYGLVNNAARGDSGVLATMREENIEALVRLNVTSTIVLSKYAVRSMMSGKGGRIVNISSIVASNGYNGLSAYSATKAALEGFTRSLARELGPLGITVNAVAPGFVDTKMTGQMNEEQREKIVRRSALKRMVECDDVADAVDYFFSEKARNITGIVMAVDAGNTV